jgi:hypothetical protein
MLCATPSRTVNLNSYIDTLYSPTITWGKIVASSPNINVSTGQINTQDFNSGTHIYSYSVNNGCNGSSGKVYIKTLPVAAVCHIPDTIAVCGSIYSAQFLNINRMLGLEASGTWDYASQLSPYVSQPAAPSQFAGAIIFNGKKAFDDGIVATQQYRSDPNARMFIFKYTPDVNSCLLDRNQRTIVVVITDKIVP